jgi:hypothetical protein
MMCEVGYAILSRLKQDKDAVDQLQADYRGRVRSEPFFRERNRLDQLLVQDVREMKEHRQSCLECGLTSGWGS